MLGTIGQLAVAPSLYSDLSFDTAKDLTSIIKVANDATNILRLPVTVAVGNILKLIDFTKSKSMISGSGSRGSTGHLAIEPFNIMAGTKTVNVLYKRGGR